jgi:hypothetical protein
MLDLLELAPGSSRRRVIKLKPFQRNRSKFAGLSFGWPGKWGAVWQAEAVLNSGQLPLWALRVAECFKLGYLEFERGGCLLPNRSLHALRHRIKIVFQERDIGVDLTV